MKIRCRKTHEVDGLKVRCTGHFKKVEEVGDNHTGVNYRCDTCGERIGLAAIVSPVTQMKKTA